MQRVEGKRKKKKRKGKRGGKRKVRRQSPTEKQAG